MPRKMRQSGVDWIGEIPEGWNIGRLKSYFSYTKGLNITKSDLTESGIPVISYGQIHAKTNSGVCLKSELLRFVSADVARQTPSAKLEVGDIVFADTSEDYEGLGNCVLVDREGVYAGYHDLVAKAKTPDFSKYFAYLFQTDVWRDQFRSRVGGIKVYSVTQRGLNDVYVLVPPHCAQRKITDFLDRHCVEIDSIMVQTKASIEDYKVLKKTLVFEAVTGKNLKGKKVASGQDWLGDIPAAWDVRRIVNLYREVSERGDDSLPILSVSINTGVSDKELSDEEQERVFIRSEDKSKYKRVQPGDLTYNMMRAWQGAFGAVRVNGMVSPAYVVARPKVEMDSRYVEYLLRSPNATREMQRYSRGIADFRLRLYWPEFKNIRIPCPPLEEQKRIADMLDEKCGEIDAVIADKERLIADLETYKKSLIFEVVTGKREVA